MRKGVRRVGGREKNLNIQQCVLNLRPTPPLTFTPYPHAWLCLDKQKAHLARQLLQEPQCGWLTAGPELTCFHMPDLLSHCYGTWSPTVELAGFSQATLAMTMFKGTHGAVCQKPEQSLLMSKISKPLKTSSPSFNVIGSAFHDCGHGLVLVFPFIMEQI